MEINHGSEKNSEVKQLSPREMYTLPSQASLISKNSLRRYIVDRLREQNNSISDAVISNSGGNMEFQKKAAEVIRCAKEPERKLLIEKFFESKDIDIKIEAAEMICFVGKSEQFILRGKVTKIIKEAFLSGDTDDQIGAAKMICHAQGLDRKSLIEEALKIGNMKVQKEAIRNIPFIQEVERKSLIKEALKSVYPEIRKEAVEMIKFLEKSEQFILREEIKETIKEALKSDSLKIKIEAISMICGVEKSEQFILREKVKEIIEEAFLNGDLDDQIGAAKMICCAYESERKLLIEKVLKGDYHIDVQKEAVKTIQYSKEPDQRLLVNLITSKELSNFFVDSPLYKDRVISDVNFERQVFKKTGSELILMGGTLKGKSIIRHIKPEAFLAWQKTYEDYKGWQEAGFNYVPIEPIQAYLFDKKKNVVNVFSGVLDLSLDSWKRKSLLFRGELNKQQEKIINILSSKGIRHNDLHDNNFVLCFFRKQDGSVDFNKVPRLYVIDFGEATSPVKRLNVD